MYGPKIFNVVKSDVKQSELNYNACIKIDDADFDHSNAGVWIHQVHDLLDRDKFTDWTKYNDDNPADEVDK